ncbi:MAG: CPBP family intramembrane metalloprotease [Oscillospiraceae bacterium]|jgi:membrane protease YdiL (CAAX protease family)|nr:CPBP family intramembrane metalloprotease [Oscillospiraceae bacterium]
MKKHKFLLQAFLIVAGIIAAISLANMVAGNGFYLFYNFGYGILLSTALPLWFVYKENGTLQSLGIKRLGLKQLIIIVSFIVFSIGGQLIPLDLAAIEFELFYISCVPLIMTTFFEEFLFRGYMQIRLEKQYGWIVAVLLSGFFFSIYHLGYPGFRTITDLLILFAVGIGFALSFKLSGGNVVVSYLVNLPNAFLTYILKAGQFPIFYRSTTVFAGITIAFVFIILFFFRRKGRSDCHVL